MKIVLGWAAEDRWPPIHGDTNDRFIWLLLLLQIAIECVCLETRNLDIALHTDFALSAIGQNFTHH